MTEDSSQFQKEFNFQIKKINVQIPYPKKKQGKKIINLNSNKISSNNLGNNNTNNKANNKSQLVNETNNIFDSLMNLNQVENEQENFNYNSDKENKLIKEQLIKVKREMENIKENIDKLNKKMINIKNKSEKLELKRAKIENQLQNIISNKETLEEMYNMEIEYIKNGTTFNYSNNNNNFCDIKIAKEEIQRLNINQFIIQIINLINKLNNETEIDSNNNDDFLSKSILDFHTNFINQLKKIKDKEEYILIYVSQISEIIENKLSKKYLLHNIKSLIHYLIKFNIFNEEINKCEQFLDNGYNIHKSKIDEEMVEITLALIFYEKNKQEILKKTSIIQEKINEKRRLKENNYINENDKYYLNLEQKQKNKEKIDSNYDLDDINEGKNENFRKNIINRSNNKIDNKKNRVINLLSNDINNIDIEKISKENTEIKNQKVINNRILENYLNSGINLNQNKKKRIRKNKTTYNSISEVNNKMNITHNYNFNTNFVDIKPSKRKIEFDKQNILVLRNLFNLNRPKRKNYNSNINLKEFNTNQNNKSYEKSFLKLNKISNNKINKNKIKNNNININKKILFNLIQRKDKHTLVSNNLSKTNFKINIPNDESFLTSYKKGNKNHNRILTSKESLLKINSKTNAKSNIKTNTSSQERNQSNNTSTKNIRHKLSNSNLILNINNNINFNSNVSYRKIKNISNLFTDNLNDININLNNLYKKEDLINDKEKKYIQTTKNTKEKINTKKYQYNNLKEGKIESFCYFKFIKGNNIIKKYNPLKVCSLNPEYYDYYECYISIDFNSGCLNISPKITLDKIKLIPSNNKKIISIKLKDINSIILEKYTKDIMKIQNILLKYDIKTNNNFSINKILKKKEICEIKLEQNEKIKAALCNFFPFSFSIKNSNIKIDIIFINYELFNIWLNNMNSIVQNNIKFTKIRKSSFNNKI